MEFACEDLPQNGLVLVPPSAPDYDALVADIQRRADHPENYSPPVPEEFRPRITEQDRATSAILLNRSGKTIAALQAVWCFETVSGRSFRHSRGMLSVQNLLLRFGRPDASRLKLLGYWHTILPGSKRYVSESGMVGDNTDVRPPGPDEEWRGGIVTGRGSGGGTGGEPVKRITLVLDGVFFLDGEFAGPDREKLFEMTVADAEAHLMVGKVARDGHDHGLTPAQIMGEIEKATGAAPERPAVNLGFRNPDATPDEFRRAALQQIAYHLGNQRKFSQLADEERMVYMLMEWTETVLPRFRKN